jgi:hypothetical protein
MQRYIRLIAYHPAIVSGRAGRDVEELSGAELVDGSILHGGGGTAGEDESDVLDVAAWAPTVGPT